jgi:hypothetical protein
VIEFIMMVSLAIIVLVVMLGLLYHMLTDYSEEKNINRLKDLGYSLQSELILAAEVEPGYERIMYIPDKVENFNFTLSQSTKDIILRYRTSDFFFPIPTVTGTFDKGNNTIRACCSGAVYVNQACPSC